MLTSDEISKIISTFPQLSKVWDQSYVARDSQKGYQHPWLNRLASEPDEEIMSELTRFDNYLGIIGKYQGFNKLHSGIRAHNLEYFTSTIAEIKTDAWIASCYKLLAIRPLLPNRKNEADFKLSLDGSSIFGEVWQARDLPSAKIENNWAPVFITHGKTEQPKRMRMLSQKGNSQLPYDVIGIWVAHIYHAILTSTFVDAFIQDMEKRPNVLGVALWVRASSSRFSTPCIRCREFKDEGHDIYWLSNKRCQYTDLQLTFKSVITI